VVPATRIVLLTRLPVAGAVKSRLVPALGTAGAAALQRELTAHALAWARAAAEGAHALQVRFTGGTVEDMRRTFGPGFDYVPQGEGDLGARMLAAFRSVADAGIGRTLVIGSDCPGLDAARLREAIARLATHDVVLGPAHDGGYYLIGLCAPEPRLFEGIGWGGETVCRDTVARARGLGLEVALLESLADVDRPADLRVWRRERRRRPALPAGARLSVIVPALDEAPRIGPLLERLSALSQAELIVADGGSRDATARLAQVHGARVVASQPGRARQMNAGAAAAEGDVLVFLHADTELPDRFADDVRAALAEPRVAGGAFRFALDAPGLRYRILERLVGWRARGLGLPYGDQALFVRADVFRGIGGFPEVELLEDVALVRAIRRRGRLVITRSAARTSARLWRQAGFARVTLANLLTVLAYFAGVPTARIARVRRRLLDRSVARTRAGGATDGRCQP
jgi:hypothetical protein